ncbi:NHS-like protein 1 [Puma concolor]|uniref:NHS-like protein 1 n=1 Tax=Puma concolor TaxID=9696 RepID=A0A6P6I126_PUMCO|nr:NHS-like protein 1 [Puma concolor]
MLINAPDPRTTGISTLRARVVILVGEWARTLASNTKPSEEGFLGTSERLAHVAGQQRAWEEKLPAKNLSGGRRESQLAKKSSLEALQKRGPQRFYRMGTRTPSRLQNPLATVRFNDVLLRVHPSRQKPWPTSKLADLSRCAGDIFGELEGQAAALGRRTAALHRRLDALHAAAARLDHRRVKIPVSNLDEESRWTVHYTAPWHQQENVFLPATRPPCVEDLHRQAKLNLKSVLRECDKLRRDGFRSSQYYSQGPTFAARTNPLCDDYQNEDEETDQKCSISSSEEERLISIRRPNTPTSSDFSDLHTQTNWTKSLPLPTPEEKMRQQAQTIQADVVPINITGENFDRQASLRRSLIYTDTLVRRPKKVKRRKTITGVPDNIQKELGNKPLSALSPASGTGQDEVGAHSVYTPDHYSTLGRLDSSRAAGQRSETRDSSCQTEEVKVVPPSMRRIRAQKGQGIAAQMSHFSGSSGNMSVLSDSAGIVFPSRLHSDAGFHSLPRSGARANIQSLEPRLGPLGPAEDLDGARPYQSGNPQVDENLGRLGGASRTRTLLRPKSQELRHFENVISPACVVSPHATYSTSIIPNATLSSSPEVIIIHAAHSPGQLDGKITSSCSYLKAKSREHLLSRHASKEGHQSHGGHWTEGHPTVLSQALDPHPPSAAMLSSLCDSAVSLNTPASRENGSQAMTYDCKNNLGFPAHAQYVDGKSESSFSEGGGHGSSEPWEYGAAGNGRASPLKARAATPGFSTPGSNMSSCSLDQTSTKDDARSLYSEEHDGFYASMHPDAGHGSGNLCNSSDGFGNPRHSVVNVFDGRARKSQGDRPRDHDKSLSRNISLKKAKKPPLPPSRTDSLRRVPKKGVQANGQALNESLIASLQHSLQLNLPGKARGGSSPSQSPCSDCEEPWLSRSRSQSTVSAGSSMTSATAPNVYSLCGATPSQSDTSSVKSEYADPWGYYIDYTGAQEDPGIPGGGCPGGSGAPAGDGPACQVQEGSGTAMPQVPGGAVKPKVTSPEKSHRVTSPSSGYSSQSNTPTALTPVPVFLKSASPANGKGKTKPKVPERKSSLVSSVSVSSSSTSLSSNTSTEGSGTMKKLDSALASPLAAVPLSKRKVLGRKDSDDDHSRNHSPSPPVTPTGAAPSLASPKQVGSIQRSVRKSSTSSDNFKALLLKKGSRADTSARMSAAEMLKNTDPRFQRSRSEPSPDAPESPSSCSPSKNRRAQEEWAKSEGLMPRSLSFSGPRYGRSRTPPSAASSRYSMRNRIQSSPMTVISEGEGEALEPVDNRARRAPGAARGCSLDGPVGDETDKGSLLCGGEPAASPQAQGPGPANGTVTEERTGPSERCGGPLGEES